MRNPTLQYFRCQSSKCILEQSGLILIFQLFTQRFRPTEVWHKILHTSSSKEDIIKYLFLHRMVKNPTKGPKGRKIKSSSTLL